jgi:hypothetical protein
MRKKLGDPEAENLPEGTTATVTTTSGMTGKLIRVFQIQNCLFRLLPLQLLRRRQLVHQGRHSRSLWTHVLRRQVDRHQPAVEACPS